MRTFLTLPDESGDPILIGVAQIVTVRYAITRRRGPEMALIRMVDGQTFEVKADVFDAELYGPAPASEPDTILVRAAAGSVAPTPPPPAKAEEPAKPVQVVKKPSSKSR